MNRILVIGDTIIDEEIHSIATGLSLESPTIKADLVSTRWLLGGAANLVKHLRRFTKNIDFFTSVKKPGLEMLSELGINILNFSKSQTNIKSRYWIKNGDSEYKILQINHAKVLNYDKEIFSEFREKVTLSNYDTVIVSDYRLGLVSEQLVKFIALNAIYSIGASQLSDKEQNFDWFVDFDLVVCNEKEAAYASMCKNLCVTLGDRGCMVGDNLFSAKKINCDSAIGAGDAFLAAYSITKDPIEANNYARKYLEGNRV